MALMMSKYIEIKTGQSTRQIRDQLWQIHEADLRDDRTGQTHVIQMDARELGNPELIDLLEPVCAH